MKRILPAIVAALLPLMAFSQEGAKSIVDELNGKRVIELNGGMGLEDLEGFFGKHDSVQSGDSDMPKYIWKVDGKETMTVFFKGGKLHILILRNERYSYLGLSQAHTLDDAISRLGALKKDLPAGAFNSAFFDGLSVRVDYRRDTRRIFSVFLYF